MVYGLWTLTMPVEGPYFLKAPRGVPAGGEVLDPGGDGGGVAAPAEGELLPRPRLHAALHRHARAQGHRVHPLLPAAARRRVCRSYVDILSVCPPADIKKYIIYLSYFCTQ